MTKFVVGQIYTTTHLYGGYLSIKVIDRDDTTITYAYADDEDEEIYIGNIIMQGDMESLLAWEYKGHNCYYYPANE